MKNDQPQIFTRRQLACLLGASAVLAVPFSAAQSASSGLALEQGQSPLPDTSLLTSTGQPFRLADAASGGLLVNFWATWCAPCIVELPALEQAAVQLKAKNIMVVLVNLDRGGAGKAQPFLEDRQIQTPLSVYDPKGGWARAVNLRGLPTTLLIKPGQAAYAVHTGPAEWASPPVLSQLTDYLR